MSDTPTPPRAALRVVSGAPSGAGPARAEAAFVCTWCALRFASRPLLEQHHLASPACRANQRVSSPLQARYGDAETVWAQPGEATLHRVRAASCRHTHPRVRLVDGEGRTIGFQCGWCYGVLPEDLPPG